MSWKFWNKSSSTHVNGMATKGFVQVGRVIKAHGLKGELCIASYADSPFLFRSLFRVYLKAEGRHPQKHGLVKVRPHSKGVLVTLDPILGRDVARQWLGAEVWVRRRDVPQQAQECLRLMELLGRAVYLESGRLLGHIDSIDDRTGQEVWIIRTPADQEVLLPAVPEFVVDLKAEQGVVVAPPPGLLELYEAGDQD